MSKGKRRLGKGLDALLPPAVPTPGPGENMREIPVADIRPNPHQPRREFDAEALAELAASIKQHGLVQPVLVVSDAGGYTLVAGERRWRAAKMAGLAAVPAIIRDLDAEQMTAVALIENLQREDLTPLEEAQAYLGLQQSFGLTQEQIADKVGKSRPQVANTLRLLQLDPRVQELLAAQSIAMGHAKVLLGVADHRVQRSLAAAAISEGLTVRNLEERLRELVAGRRPAAGGKGAKSSRRPEVDPVLVAMTRSLEQVLATPVAVQPPQGRRPGRIMIEFYGDEDLERLYDLLLGEEQADTNLGHPAGGGRTANG